MLDKDRLQHTESIKEKESIGKGNNILIFVEADWSLFTSGYKSTKLLCGTEGFGLISEGYRNKIEYVLCEEYQCKTGYTGKSYYESFIPSTVKVKRYSDTCFTYPIFSGIDISDDGKKVTKTIHNYVLEGIGRYESLYSLRDTKKKWVANANDSARQFSKFMDDFMFCRFHVGLDDDKDMFRNTLVNKDVISLYRQNCLNIVSDLAEFTDDEDEVRDEIENPIIIDTVAITNCVSLIEYFSTNEKERYQERKKLCNSFIQMQSFNKPLSCCCLQSDRLMITYLKKFMPSCIYEKNYYLDIGINLIGEIKSSNVIQNGRLNYILDYPMKILSTVQDKMCFKRAIDYDNIKEDTLGQIIQMEKNIFGSEYTQLIICEHLCGVLHIYQFQNTNKYRLRVHSQEIILVNYGVLLILTTLLQELASFIDICNVTDKKNKINYNSSLNVKFPTDAFRDSLDYCNNFIHAVISFIICILSQGFIEEKLLVLFNNSVTNSGFLSGTVKLDVLWDIVSDEALIGSYMMENFNLLKAVRALYAGLLPIFVENQLQYDCCVNRVFITKDSVSDLYAFINTLEFTKQKWFKNILRKRINKSEEGMKISDILCIDKGADILLFNKSDILSVLSEYIINDNNKILNE